MTLASLLLRAPHIGVRKFKSRLSSLLKKGGPLIITDRGTPLEVVIPYEEALEMVDLIDEATDTEALEAVQKGRIAIKRGKIGIPVERIFKKIRKGRK